jgi:hypothetical protein
MVLITKSNHARRPPEPKAADPETPEGTPAWIRHEVNGSMPVGSVDIRLCDD